MTLFFRQQTLIFRAKFICLEINFPFYVKELGSVAVEPDVAAACAPPAATPQGGSRRTRRSYIPDPSLRRQTRSRRAPLVPGLDAEFAVGDTFFYSGWDIYIFFTFPLFMGLLPFTSQVNFFLIG